MFRTLLTAAALAALSGPVLADPMIMDPYARSSGPLARAGAAFMMIHGGETDDRLIAARSDAAQRVELHTHLVDDSGLARMVQLEEGIAIPAGAMVPLKRGGMHVMFMGLTQPFEQGDMLAVTLVFEEAGEVEVMVPVDLERQPEHGAMDHGNH